MYSNICVGHVGVMSIPATTVVEAVTHELG